MNIKLTFALIAIGLLDFWAAVIYLTWRCV